MIKSIKSDNDRIMTFNEHIKSKALKINEQMCLTISEPDNEIACSMELALRRRVMSLKNNPQFSDVEIITPCLVGLIMLTSWCYLRGPLTGGRGRI